MPLPLREALALLPSPLTSLVVGGTSGIGAGVVIALAQHLHPRSQVILAGRRADAGASVVAAAKAKAKAVAVSSTMETAAPVSAIAGSNTNSSDAHDAVRFKQVDASLMAEIQSFCASLAKELLSSTPPQRLDVLVLSQGVLNFSRLDTSEGIETVIATNYYGRMCFVRELAKRGVLSDSCLVINILNGKAGDPTGKTIDFSDMDMRRTGIVASIQQNMAMSDVIIQDLGIEQERSWAEHGEVEGGSEVGRESKRTFIHNFPGHVKTELVKNSVLKFVFGVTEFFRRRLMSIETAGEIIVAGSVACTERTRNGEKGYWYVDEAGEEIVKAEAGKEVRKKVREHTWNLIDQALAGGVKHG
jgi:NAD(P)-dependent dehydrogenase (short-subunit alcohol dehydrogenase family)